MISIPDTHTLKPQAFSGDPRIALFPSRNIDLVKIDLLFEAGSAYQQQKLCASAASKLYTLATRRMTSAQVAEFMDFRGIITETTNEVFQSAFTIYTLARHLEELMPLVHEMFLSPAFAEEDYVRWQQKRHEEIATLEQRTSHLARRLFYQALFGDAHPLGVYATADDVYRLQLDTVVEHWKKHYDLSHCKVVLAGNIEKCSVFSEQCAVCSDAAAPGTLNTEHSTLNTEHLTLNTSHFPLPTSHFPLPTATQTSIRIGRILPIAWNSVDYARFIILTTALGGWFGSRLMRNIREDKGYTYGIYARTQIYRGCIVFYITADVAAGTADAAIEQVFNELESLARKPLPQEELTLVKNVLVGDFLRSVDGIFELSSRYCDMQANGVDERLTDNLRTAIKETTATQLQELAQRLLKVDDMTVCTAGV